MFWNPQATMGPDDTQADTKLCPYCAEEVQAAAVKCKHCHSWIGGQWDRLRMQGGGKPAGGGLRRTTQDRKVFGVCGGLARSLGIDPTLVRVAYALGTFFSFVVPGIAAYLIMTWAIPNDDQPYA